MAVRELLSIQRPLERLVVVDQLQLVVGAAHQQVGATAQRPELAITVTNPVIEGENGFLQVDRNLQCLRIQ
ncbi:hypothetical protein D3C85_1884970 [compost metagenome]